MGYSQSSPNGHLYKIGTFINRTFRVGHFFLYSFKSTLEKTDDFLRRTHGASPKKVSI